MLVTMDTQIKSSLSISARCELLMLLVLFNLAAAISKCIEDHSRQTYFTLQCTTGNDPHQQLVIFVDPKVKITMKCINLYSYEEFEKFELPMNGTNDVGNFATVHMLNCPLSSSRSLGEIIRHFFGIGNYKTLHFVNSNMTRNMTKSDLQDFSENMRKLVLEIWPTMYATEEDLLADKSLRQLKHLYLYGNVVELHCGIYESLKNLVTLHIECNLKSLPDQLLANQDRLRHLTLANNQLTALDGDVFGRNRPQYLDVENNNLYSLQANTMHMLTNVISINFFNNSLRLLPEMLFLNNKRLEKFQLIEKTVALKHLPNALLADLTSLQEVKIECGLEEVPSNVFTNSTNILKIILAHNNLQNLSEQLFQSQTLLRYLDLSHNQLRNLSNQLFENLSSLLELKLSHNNLRTVDLGSQLFLSLRRMKLLDLESNRLSSFIALPFDGVLHTLSLRNNSVSSMFSLQNNVSSTLQKLDLSYNRITNVKSKNFELIFASNLLLDLRFNRIQTIDLKGYGTRTQWNGRLLQVDLNSNPLKCDCHLLEFVKYLAKEKDGLRFKVDKVKCTGPTRHVNNVFIKQLHMKDLLCPERQQCPQRCCNECWRRPYDNTLIVNCSQRGLRAVPNLPDVQQLSLNHMELYLENNQLSQLPLGNTTGYDRVNILSLDGNQLTSVESAHLPTNLKMLNLKNNLLESVNVGKIINSLKHLQSVTMSGNPFSCNCYDMSFWQKIHNTSHIFVDYRNLTCIDSSTHSSQSVQIFKFFESCAHKAFTPIVSFAIAFSIGFLAFGLYYKYLEEIQIWLYAHKWLCWLVAQYEINDNKIYDAFVAYSPPDEPFVVEHLAPELENNAPFYTLCLPLRDWLVGDCIPDQIVQTIDNSKRTIFVLTRSFVRSVWSKLEFKYTHQAGLTDKRPKVIIIVLEDMGNVDELDLSLKAHLKTHNCFQWMDKRFWSKLRYAMPHKRCMTQHRI